MGVSSLGKIGSLKRVYHKMETTKEKKKTPSKTEEGMDKMFGEQCEISDFYGSEF